MTEIVYMLGQVFVYVVAAVCIAAGVYGTKLVWRLRGDITMQKRGVLVHFGTISAFIFWMVCITLFMAANISFPPSTASNWVSTLCVLFTAVCGYSFICFSLIKAWLIFFHEKWSYYALRSEWYQIINSNAASNDSNWYIRNKRKYGSRSYVTKVCIIYHSICMAITTFGIIDFHFDLTHPLLHVTLQQLPILPSFLVYFVLLCKTTRFELIDDSFLIHWEAKIHSRLQLALILLVAITSSLISTDLPPQVSWMIASLIPICILYALVHVSTFSIYKRLRGIHDDDEHSLVSQASVSYIHRAGSPRGASRVKVSTILSDETSLHLFLGHLFKEYSAECLLSVIEIQQYQNYQRAQMTDAERSELEDSYNLALPESMPLSSIVEDAATDWRMKAYLLYNKYILIGSEYEVNISYTTRNRFVAIMANRTLLLENQSLKMQDFHDLFDNVKAEMLKLLRFSLDRFECKEDYAKVLNRLRDQDSGHGQGDNTSVTIEME